MPNVYFKIKCSLEFENYKDIFIEIRKKRKITQKETNKKQQSKLKKKKIIQELSHISE